MRIEAQTPRITRAISRTHSSEPFRLAILGNNLDDQFRLPILVIIFVFSESCFEIEFPEIEFVANTTESIGDFESAYKVHKLQVCESDARLEVAGEAAHAQCNQITVPIL